MNWYVYCGNNPLKYVDPSGLLQLVNSDNDDVEVDVKSSDYSHHRRERNERDRDSDNGSNDAINNAEIFDVGNINFHQEPVYYKCELLGYGAEAEKRKQALIELEMDADWNEVGQGSLLLVGGIAGMITSAPVVIASSAVSIFDDTFAPLVAFGAANAFVESSAIAGFGFSKILSGLTETRGPSLQDIPTTITHAPIEIQEALEERNR